MSLIRSIQRNNGEIILKYTKKKEQRSEPQNRKL